MSDRRRTPETQDFDAARDAYRQARNDQRLLIVDALKSAGFTVKTRGNAGRGLTKYSSGGRLAPPFDLSGWMWVAGERAEVFLTVSLQVLDQDPSSLNVHALMDRIVVHVFRAGDEIDNTDPLLERATTDLQLPLNTAEIETLLALIEAKAKAPG